MTFQGCPKLYQLTPSHPPVIGGELSLERLVTLDEMGFCR